MRSNNRNVKAAFESAMSNPGISLVDITEPTTADWLETLATASPPAAIAFFAGIGWGKLAYSVERLTAVDPNLFSLTLGFTFALVIYLAVFVFHTLQTATRYFAEKEPGIEPTETPAAALIRTARYQQRIRLSSRMREMLTRFARHYAEIGTMGITRWEQSKYFNQSQIISVRNYAVLIGAAVKDENNQATLTEWGRGQLSKWAAGDFGDVIELSKD